MRQPGFYWTIMNGYPVVSGWTGEVWRVVGQYHEAFDSDFDKIYETPIPPPEDAIEFIPPTSKNNPK